MIFRIYVSYKKGILDPEAESIKKTIQNMGIECVTQVSKGKFFDLEVSDGSKHIKQIEKVSKDLLSNPVIEKFVIKQIK